MKKRLTLVLQNIRGFFSVQFRIPKRRLVIEAGAVVVILGIVIFMVLSGRNTSTADLKKGVSYIKSLEKKDTAAVEKEIKSIQKEERKIALENGELDVWQQFNDTAILGDSRAVGFYSYEFLDHSRVMAEAGATIRNIPDSFEQLKNLNPSSIILCYGLNDISIGFWNTVDEYIAELDDMVAQLRENVEGATVYVNSIIPATDPAFQRSEKWRAIPEWNEAIKEHCQEADIPYIDINEAVKEHSDLYDIDGIHMQKPFYEYWAIDIITEVNDNENE